VLKTLKDHADLGIQISGYASPEGDSEANRKLSNQRATKVLNFFNQRGVVRRRIIALGYGETSDDTTSAEEGRRVEIKLIDLNEVGR
jgi:outer membrane protein OmpA-like peptidoglycan-associated protein